MPGMSFFPSPMPIMGKPKPKPITNTNSLPPPLSLGHHPRTELLAVGGTKSEAVVEVGGCRARQVPDASVADEEGGNDGAARIVALSHRDERVALMVEFSAWSDVALGGAGDWGADGHEIRGCVMPDAGPTAPRTGPARPSWAWMRRTVGDLMDRVTIAGVVWEDAEERRCNLWLQRRRRRHVGGTR